MYDGPHDAQDINYQASLVEFEANWQDCKYCARHQLACGPCFGASSVDKGLSIAWYSVAMGSNANFDQTKANIKPFTNVGLNTSVVFRFTAPLAPQTRFYFTVRGYSMPDVYNEATSNGIMGGFTLGLQAGNVITPAYVNNLLSLSVSWSAFGSWIPIFNYDVWLAAAANASHQVTQAIAIGTAEQLILTNLSDTLVHASAYVACVQATDQSLTRNISCSLPFVVDLTPPCAGTVLHSNSALSPALTVSYEAQTAEVTVLWRNFYDNESSIARYEAVFLSSSTCALLQERNITTALQPGCGSGRALLDSGYLDSLPWKTVGDQAQTNYTHRLSQDETLQAQGRYMLLLRAVNNAGLAVIASSPVIVLDPNTPTAGTVKVGANFRKNVQYQSSNSSMAASWTHAFLPTQLDCPITITFRFAGVDPAWTPVSRFCRNGQCSASYPADRNLLADELAFDPNRVAYDIEGLAVSMIPRRSGVFYTGSLVTQLSDSLDGTYTFLVRPAVGANVVNSIFWWDGDPQSGMREPMYYPGDGDSPSTMVLAPVVSYDALGVATSTPVAITAVGLQLRQLGNSSDHWLVIMWSCASSSSPIFNTVQLDWDLSNGFTELRVELVTGLEHGVKSQGDLYVNGAWSSRFLSFPSMVAAHLGFAVYPADNSVTTAPVFRIAQAAIPAPSDRLCKVCLSDLLCANCLSTISSLTFARSTHPYSVRDSLLRLLWPDCALRVGCRHAT